MTGSGGRAEQGRRRVQDRLERLARTREERFLGAILARYQEIDGSTLGALISIQFFTTVIPLIIIGVGYFSGFSATASPGAVFSRELGVHGTLADRVRETFGTSAELHSTWTIIGVTSLLIWGIPMSVSIAGMFARAWRREQFSFGGRLWRGATWFALYLALLLSREAIDLVDQHSSPVSVLMFIVGLLPTWLFWTLTPVVLVREGGRGMKFLAVAGLGGVVIDGVVIPLAAHLVFPRLLSGWSGFGPIGVAITLMTWCGVVGIGWVVTACVSAVVWERTAPPDTVVQAQTEPEAEPAVS